VSRLPSLVVTGASGIVGRSLVEAAQDRFQIYAIARRPQKRAGVANHPNVRWIQVDIGNAAALERVTANIKAGGGADAVIHLAAYYDFENVETPEYARTNVSGTRNVLEQARALEVKHFLFASSVAACRFPEPGSVITEDTPPDAGFPYARSKKAGEAMVRDYCGLFTCSIVRLAAVFSDWCEYAPGMRASWGEKGCRRSLTSTRATSTGCSSRSWTAVRNSRVAASTTPARTGRLRSGTCSISPPGSTSTVP
jgi:nucleoside-diphosphate-sugar epimerase